MLPKDTAVDDFTMLMIWGFKMVLEDMLLPLNPEGYVQFYTVQKEYNLQSLDLVDALERSCKILMTDACLLESFRDIPREGYSFEYECRIDSDHNIAMWLSVNIEDFDGTCYRPLGEVKGYSGINFETLLQFARENTCMLRSPAPKGAYDQDPGTDSDNNEDVATDSNAIDSESEVSTLVQDIEEEACSGSGKCSPDLPTYTLRDADLRDADLKLGVGSKLFKACPVQ